MLKRGILLWLLVLVPLQPSGCAPPAKQLERVAKDWCLTIRASQVLPVYPLSEDTQPGDVFLVQTPLSQQIEIYKDKGFLPLDQLVKRLSELDYSKFYKDAYWKGTYASVSHERPGWPAQPGPNAQVAAPRAAFPSYNFSVKRGGGIQLAIPIHGIPVGLGLMGASRAAGTVTIKDAYTYGIDGEVIGRLLYTWWNSSIDAPETLKAIAKASETPIYLRIVTRVYLTGSIEVSLVNLDEVSAGADVGQAPKLQLPDLSKADPATVEASAKAYQAALDAISQQLNVGGVAPPGGAVRFAHASQRSVIMTQIFDRPLAIGYRGFDVQVFKDGTLSTPIPSFSVITGHLGKKSFKSFEEYISKGRSVARLRLGKKRAVISSIAPNNKLDQAKWKALVDRSNLSGSDKTHLKQLSDINSVNARLDLDAAMNGKIIAALHGALGD